MKLIPQSSSTSQKKNKKRKTQKKEKTQKKKKTQKKTQKKEKNTEQEKEKEKEKTLKDSFEKKNKKKPLETLEENFIQMYQPFQRESISLHKGGIFCYMPYDALDRYEKSIFKIDTSNDIEQKIQDL